jgi:hypothetical protein
MPPGTRRPAPSNKTKRSYGYRLRSIYRREQFFYVSKAGCGVGHRVPVLRDFRFQRFLPAAN